MDKLATKNLGGFPFVLDDIRQLLGRLTSPANHGIYQAFNNLLRGYGDNFIIQGCVLGGSSGAFTLTEGWILLDGELIKVDAQGPFNESGPSFDNTFVKDTTFDPRGNKSFLNGSTADTYEKNRANISGSGGSLAFNGDTLNDIAGLTEWTNMTLTGNDFEVNTQGGGNNWAVDLPSGVPSGDVLVARFRKIGKTVHVQVFIDGSAINVGSSVQELIIKSMPFTSKTSAIGFAAFQDFAANTSFTGKVKMEPAGTILKISLTSGSSVTPNISASSNITVQLELTVEIS